MCIMGINVLFVYGMLFNIVGGQLHIKTCVNLCKCLNEYAHLTVAWACFAWLLRFVCEADAPQLKIHDIHF